MDILIRESRILLKSGIDFYEFLCNRLKYKSNQIIKSTLDIRINQNNTIRLVDKFRINTRIKHELHRIVKLNSPFNGKLRIIHPYRLRVTFPKKLRRLITFQQQYTRLLDDIKYWYLHLAYKQANHAIPPWKIAASQIFAIKDIDTYTKNRPDTQICLFCNRVFAELVEHLICTECETIYVPPEKKDLPPQFFKLLEQLNNIPGMLIPEPFDYNRYGRFPRFLPDTNDISLGFSPDPAKTQMFPNFVLFNENFHSFCFDGMAVFKSTKHQARKDFLHAINYKSKNLGYNLRLIVIESDSHLLVRDTRYSNKIIFIKLNQLSKLQIISLIQMISQPLNYNIDEFFRSARNLPCYSKNSD